LPSTVVFDYPTPTALARFVAEQLGPQPDAAADEVREHITRITTAAATIAPDDQVRGELALRLRAALDLLDPRTEPGTGQRPVGGAELGDATDEEVFSFIGKEFGIT
jgi:hypothetical protein